MFLNCQKKSYGENTKPVKENEGYNLHKTRKNIFKKSGKNMIW